MYDTTTSIPGLTTGFTIESLEGNDLSVGCDYVVGLNVLTAPLMIENFRKVDNLRSRTIWCAFMKNDLICAVLDSLFPDFACPYDCPSIGIQEDRPEVSVAYVSKLKQNTPNPFYRRTSILYQLCSSDFVTLQVYDIVGRLVRTLVSKEQTPGFYVIHWNGEGQNGARISSGIYFYHLTVGEFTKTRKMIVLR